MDGERRQVVGGDRVIDPPIGIRIKEMPMEVAKMEKEDIILPKNQEVRSWIGS